MNLFYENSKIFLSTFKMGKSTISLPELVYMSRRQKVLTQHFKQSQNKNNSFSRVLRSGISLNFPHSIWEETLALSLDKSIIIFDKYIFFILQRTYFFGFAIKR